MKKNHLFIFSVLIAVALLAVHFFAPVVWAQSTQYDPITPASTVDKPAVNVIGAPAVNAPGNSAVNLPSDPAVNVIAKPGVSQTSEQPIQYDPTTPATADQTAKQATQQVPVAVTQSSKIDKITNPLKVDTIQDFVYEILKFAVDILAIAGVAYIMYSGLLFVKAQGNPEELKVAKKTFFNAIIGTGIILGAWAIASVVAQTISKITQDNNVTLKSHV